MEWWTYPLVVVLYLLSVAFTADLTDVYTYLSVGVVLLTAYLLSAMQTTFALIHTRTSLPQAFYVSGMACCPFLLPYTSADWLPLIGVLVLTTLFSSYEAGHRTLVHVFHTFVLMGMAICILPSLVFLIPFLLLCMRLLRTWNGRTLLAALLGLFTPAWAIGAWALWAESGAEVLAYFTRDLLLPIDFTVHSAVEWITAIALLVIVTGAMVLTLGRSYSENTQTRIFLHTIILLQLATLFFMFLQPQHLLSLLPVQLLLGSFLVGNYYAQTYTRLSASTFYTILGLLGALFLLNIWTAS